MRCSCEHVEEVRQGEFECRLTRVSIMPDCGRISDEVEDDCIPLKSVAWLAGTLNIQTISDKAEVEAIMRTARQIQERAVAGSESEAATERAEENDKGRRSIRLEGLTEKQLDTLIARAKEIKRRASGGRRLLPRIQAYRNALERQVAETAQLIDLLIRAMEAIEAGRIPPKLPKIPRVLTPEERAKISERMKAMRAAKESAGKKRVAA